MKRSTLTLAISTLIITPSILITGCSSTTPKPIKHTNTALMTPAPQSTSPIQDQVVLEAQKSPAISSENAIIEEINNDPNSASQENLTSDPVLLEIAEAIEEIPETSIKRPAKTTFKFGFDKQELPADEKDIIIQHGRFLSQHPEKRIQVHGHADSHGATLYNQALSAKRANHVAELLLQQGVLKKQIEIFSWGSDKPSTGSNTQKDQRRVEIFYDDSLFATAPTHPTPAANQVQH